MTEATLITLPAAQPAPPKPSAWAGAVLALLALGLIASGGCFLVGVGVALDLLHVVIQDAPHVAHWSPAQSVYVVILYACAAGCLSGGTAVAVLCVKLVRTGR